MDRPRLSALLLNYNQALFLPRSMQALIDEARGPVEIIVVDDGSTDNSREVIERIAGQAPAVRCVFSERNEGFWGAASRARAAAAGEYLYFASADDRVLPGFFEKAMVLAARHPEAGLIFGKMVVVDLAGRERMVCQASRWQEALFAPPDRFLAEYLEAEKPTHSQSAATIYRRSAFEEAGGLREDLGHWCDTFLIRAIGLKHGACYIPEPCAAWTRIAEGIAGSASKDPFRMLDIVERAARLMRSPEYAGRFPEDHVRRWEQGYRRIVIDDSVAGLSSGHETARSILRRGAAQGGAMNRLLGGIASLCMGLDRRVAAALVRRALARYRTL